MIYDQINFIDKWTLITILVLTKRLTYWSGFYLFAQQMNWMTDTTLLIVFYCILRSLGATLHIFFSFSTSVNSKLIYKQPNISSVNSTISASNLYNGLSLQHLMNIWRILVSNCLVLCLTLWDPNLLNHTEHQYKLSFWLCHNSFDTLCLYWYTFITSLSMSNIAKIAVKLISVTHSSMRQLLCVSLSLIRFHM